MTREATYLVRIPGAIDFSAVGVNEPTGSVARRLGDKIYASPPRRRGRGYESVVDLTADEIGVLRDEAECRREVNLPAAQNPYGNETPDHSERRAAEALIGRLTAFEQAR